MEEPLDKPECNPSCCSKLCLKCRKPKPTVAFDEATDIIMGNSKWSSTKNTCRPCSFSLTLGIVVQETFSLVLERSASLVGRRRLLAVTVCAHPVYIDVTNHIQKVLSFLLFCKEYVPIPRDTAPFSFSIDYFMVLVIYMIKTGT